MDIIDQRLLREIADLEKTPQGAYNIRKNGQLESRSNSANIVIESKTDKPGIDIHIAPGTKNESLHIPVVVTQTGLKDLVYNDFFIGEDCDVIFTILPNGDIVQEVLFGENGVAKTLTAGKLVCDMSSVKSIWNKCN